MIQSVGRGSLEETISAAECIALYFWVNIFISFYQQREGTGKWDSSRSEHEAPFTAQARSSQRQK